MGATKSDEVTSGSFAKVFPTVLKGVGPLKGAAAAARQATSGGRTKRQAVASLTRTHVMMAGAPGFASGVGGLVATIFGQPRTPTTRRS